MYESLAHLITPSTEIKLKVFPTLTPRIKRFYSVSVYTAAGEVKTHSGHIVRDGDGGVGGVSEPTKAWPATGRGGAGKHKAATPPGPCCHGDDDPSQKGHELQ